MAVLVSGTGTLLQSMIDSFSAPSSLSTAPEPGSAPAVEIVVVGSDVADCGGLQRASAAGIPTFALPLAPFAERGTPARRAWDTQLADQVESHGVDLVVLAGFMKLFDEPFLDRFEGRIINSHPSLLPSFPGQHAPRDALAYGVKISGASVFAVDGGIDTGKLLAQVAVDVFETDTVETLHERIKVAERAMLVDTVAHLARQRTGP